MDKDKKFIIRNELDKDPEFKEKWDMLDPEMQQYYLDVQDEKRVVSFYNDAAFKNVMDPDLKRDRLSQLISLVIGKKVRVLFSVYDEEIERAIYSKEKIIDLVAQLESKQYINVEIHVDPSLLLGNTFLQYNAEIFRWQFNVLGGECKKELEGISVKEIHMIAFVKEGFPESVDVKEYKHTLSVVLSSNVEFTIPVKHHLIETDKYLNQIQGKVPEDSLDAWIAFIGTDDVKLRNDIINRYSEFNDLNEELLEMSFDRDNLLSMINSTLELYDKANKQKQGYIN